MTEASGVQTVGILIFDDVEVLDFCGPFEVFSVTRRRDETSGDTGLFNAVTIAEQAKTIHCRGGLLVVPHYTIDDHPPLDILVVPGGQGTRREISNDRLIRWIDAQSRTISLTTSVCTGAFLLAANGLLNGHRATTHWGSIDWMRQTFPAVQIEENVRFVDEGKIVTSAGISAGIDMALHIVERLHGREVAGQTARHMEYDWRP